jgi:MFS family permease
MGEHSQNIPLWTLKATYFLTGGTVALIMNFIAVYYYQVGMNTLYISYIFLGAMLAKFLGTLFWSFLGDRSKRIKHIFFIYLIGGTATMLLLPIDNHFEYLFWNAVVRLFLCSSCDGLIDAVSVWAVKHSEESFGQQRLWRPIGWGIFSIIGGVLIDEFGFFALFIQF